MSEELTTITAGIVSAFVSHNNTRPEDMVDLVKQVHGRLAEVVKGKRKPSEEAIVPALPIRKSVTHDAIFCLVCGSRYKLLKRHLNTAHQLDPTAYREMFGLKPDYSLTAASHSEARSKLALKLGLGRKVKGAEPAAESEPTKPVNTKKTKSETTKTVRSHSKAEQTRRKASSKDKKAAESVAEAA